MTRIVGGELGGRRLRTPSGSGTRPTTDRVREALFSALEAQIGTLSGRRVLDLYAGSGAVGIEAASRGASHVVLVESDRRAAAMIRRNLDELGVRGSAVLARPVEKVLSAPPAGSAAEPFNVVYVDPPYSLPSAALLTVLTILADHDWLTPGAVVLVERSARDPEPTWPPDWSRTRSRVYGETVVWWLTAGSAPPSSPGD